MYWKDHSFVQFGAVLVHSVPVLLFEHFAGPKRFLKRIVTISRPQHSASLPGGCPDLRQTSVLRTRPALGRGSRRSSGRARCPRTVDTARDRRGAPKTSNKRCHPAAFRTWKQNDFGAEARIGVKDSLQWTHVGNNQQRIRETCGGSPPCVHSTRPQWTSRAGFGNRRG